MVFVVANSVLTLPLLPSTAQTTKTRFRQWKSAASQFSSSSSSSCAMSSSAASSGGAAMLGMEFPYLPLVHQRLMSDLLSTMDAQLGPHLLPSDPLAFENDSGSSKGALDIVSGAPGSPVDFILTSWIHCTLPFGVLNITTLFAFLNPSVTSAPHLLLEFIQSSPTSLVLLMDLLPRKDLVLDPDYLRSFYEQTQLDTHRQSLASLPAVKPYVSSSLFIRSVLSPTAVAVSIGCEGEGEMEEVVRVHVGEAARGMVGTWLERCSGGGGGEEGGGVEVEELRRRDGVIKRKAIEIDLTANLPRLFGEEVAKKVVAAVQKAFGV